MSEETFTALAKEVATLVCDGKTERARCVLARLAAAEYGRGEANASGAQADGAFQADLKQELTSLLNRYSLENGSDTPDFILAQYLLRCLETFNHTIRAREQWHGRELGPAEHACVPRDNPETQS